MKRSTFALSVVALGVVGSFGVVACSSSSSDAATKDGTSSTLSEARSAQTRDAAPNLSDAEKTTLATGNASFAVDIFQAVSKTPDSANQNLFLSPYSISSALGMVYAGARGTTASEMKTALHFDLPDDRVATGFNYLDLALTSRGAGAEGKDGQPFRLNIANALFSQKGLPFETPFLDTMAKDYGAGVEMVDFVGQTEPSRVAINQWVEDKTEDRIKDLVPQGAVNTSTRLVIVNAVYFNASWANAFEKLGTAPASFTKADGSVVGDVDMMHEVTTLPYAKTADFQAIELPYDGGDLSMLVIAPTAGTYIAYESALTGAKLLDVEASLQNTDVDLSFPKLQLESKFSVKSALQSLGMKAAFEAADFSGIVKGEQLSIGDVLHKSFLDLDENGTEAAAATAVIMDGGVTLDAPPPEKVDINRSFITAIIDRPTKTVVFIGRILSPKI